MEVMIADASMVVREQIRFLLSDVPDITLVGEAVNAHEALEALRARSPHVVVLDNSMPCSGEFTVLRRANHEQETPTLVMLRVFSYEVSPGADLEDGTEFVRDETFIDQPLALALRQLAHMPVPVAA